MSSHKKIPAAFQKNKTQSYLNHMLDFGSEPTNTNPVSLTSGGLERIKQIVKKLQEINKRLDELASRL